MFDISFGELLVIGIVALVVIGPEKLPGVARTVGALVGRLQRYVNDVKTDIQREAHFSELKQLGNEMTNAADSLRQTIHKQMNEVEDAAREVRSGIETPLAEAGAAVRDAGEGLAAALDPQAAASAAPAAVPAPEAEAVPESAPLSEAACAAGTMPAVDDGQLDLFASATPPQAPPPAGDVSSKAA